MEGLEMFPEVPVVPEEPKQRKQRRKSTRYSQKENNRRYRLHRMVKDLKLEEVKLHVRLKVIEIPVMFEIELYPPIEELINKFKYHAPTEYLPKIGST